MGIEGFDGSGSVRLLPLSSLRLLVLLLLLLFFPGVLLLVGVADAGDVEAVGVALALVNGFGGVGFAGEEVKSVDEEAAALFVVVVPGLDRSAGFGLDADAGPVPATPAPANVGLAGVGGFTLVGGLFVLVGVSILYIYIYIL